MLHLHIIAGTTRPNRLSKSIADWVYKTASTRKDVSFELVDVADYNLPVFDEPRSPMMQQYEHDHTKKWSEKIQQADGYIFVTGEYNHSIPGVFKNAVDFLNHEWRNKALGFVSYGSAGGARAVEHWRGVAGELHMADVREALHLYLGKDFDQDGQFAPTEAHADQLQKIIDAVNAWSGALKTLQKS